MNLGPQMLHLKQGSPFPPLKHGVLRLYNMRFCPYAQRTRLVLIHKRIPHETVNVNLKHKPDWFLARHPFGLVPVLEQNGEIVYESSVCDDFLEDAYPEQPLYPKNPTLKTRHKMTMAVAEKVIGRFNAVKAKDIEAKQKSLKKMSKEIGVLESMLQGTFFEGDGPMMVDYHVWPWFERLPALEHITGLTFLPQNECPKLNRWVDAMKIQPAVQETMLSTELHLEFMLSFATGTPSYDAGLAVSKL